MCRCSRWHCWQAGKAATSFVMIDTALLVLQLMAQPPFDSEMGDYYILHYTYGNEFNNDGNMVLGERHAVLTALLLGVSLGSA